MQERRSEKQFPNNAFYRWLISSILPGYLSISYPKTVTFKLQLCLKLFHFFILDSDTGSCAKNAIYFAKLGRIAITVKKLELGEG